MDMLRAALDWGRRGFRVFRLVPGGKTPLREGWQSEATDDPLTIHALWTETPAANIGLAMGRGRHAIDLDVKDGATGPQTFSNLNLTFDTLTWRSPSGGYNLVYESPEDYANNVRLLPGLDVRSAGGYVVAPPSVTRPGMPGVRIAGSYSLEVDIGPAPLPEVLKAILRPPLAAQTVEILANRDGLLSIDQAIRYAGEAEPAVKGQGRNNRFYNLAARLCRDLALSPEIAAAILWERYNPRCLPPYTQGEYARFRATVENAARYGRHAIGECAPERMLEHVNPVPEPLDVKYPEIGRFGNVLPRALREQTEWVIENLMARGHISTGVGPGGVGKSTLAVTIALAIAQGTELAPGWRTPRPGKVMLIDMEDTRSFISEKIEAYCLNASIDYELVKSRLNIIGAGELPFKLTENKGISLNPEFERTFSEAIARNDVIATIFTPFSKLNDADENSPTEMDNVMQVLADWTRKVHVATLFFHHTSKFNKLAEMPHGEQDVGRGASSIMNGSRAGFTFLKLDKIEAGLRGIPDEERRLYARLEIAKTNLGPDDVPPLYFKRLNFTNWRGMPIPVLMPHSWDGHRNEEAATLARLIWEAMGETASASITKTELVKKWKAADEIRGKQDEKTLKNALDRIYHASGGCFVFDSGEGVKTFVKRQEGQNTLFVLASMN